MSHCHDEHEGHDHGHDHSHGAHDHSDDITPALQNHIYQQIDFDAINTLNESSPKSGSQICQKTWDKRLDPEPELCSDADEQLLMHIPYASYYCSTVVIAHLLNQYQFHSPNSPAFHSHPNFHVRVGTNDAEAIRESR